MSRRDATATDLWEEAGQAWGARSTDWACLFEHYARPAHEVVFDQLGVSIGLSLVDIACGSGLAAQYASRRGAAVTGLDASEALVDIARARTPGGDFLRGLADRASPSVLFIVRCTTAGMSFVRYARRTAYQATDVPSRKRAGNSWTRLRPPRRLGTYPRGL